MSDPTTERQGQRAQPRPFRLPNIRQAVSADIPEIVRFVQSVLLETGARKAPHFDVDFYRWQYDVNRDVILIAEDRHSVLAHYPLVAYPMFFGTRPITAGVCQDLSVDESMRGNGVFREMGRLAHQHAVDRDFDLLFAFPNPRSLPGFIKHHGYSLAGELVWRATVIRPSELAPAGLLRTLTRLLPLDAVRSLFRRSDGALPATPPWDLGGLQAHAVEGDSAIRHPLSNAFIEWRFGQRPHTRYWGLVEHEGGEAVAWGAIRTIEMKGVRVGLIVDLDGLPGRTRAFRRLLHSLRDRLWEEAAALALFVHAPAFRFLGELTLNGFLPVPAHFVPRPLKLVTRALRPELEVATRDLRGWQINLADWDVF